MRILHRYMNSFTKNRKTILFKLFASLAVIFLYLLFTTHFSRKDLVMPDNALFVDRNGATLRFVPDDKGERHTWLPLKDIPDVVKKAFIAAEDKRFYDHPGFDLGAIIRALKDNYRSGRIVSGASTITQQTARLIYPRKRTYRDKFIEILRSIRMELILSKGEILEQYLNRVPMGNNLIGVELAAGTYFGKSVARLSAAEAALLASLPKAPGALNPYGENVYKLFDRKDTVISSMRECGFISEEDALRAKKEKILFRGETFPNMAPHMVDLLYSSGRYKTGKVATTIDQNIQSKVEEILSSHETRLSYKGAGQAAAMVVHNRTMEVLALAGSISYESKNKGFNNGALALRSAGSTLKPFAYALALEDGNNVTWLLDDVLRKYKTPKGEYSPANFDRKEYGPVTMRTALGNSLNISAIKMLETVGQERFYDLLKSMGLINNQSKAAEHYGLGLVIGNPEVSLEQLVSAYAIMANGGVKRPLRYSFSSSPQSSFSGGSPLKLKGKVKAERIFSEQTAYIISDILSDETARVITFGNAGAMTFPFRVAVKTGTSTKYRDCWAIGYTREYTVGVWVGNFEGNPTFNLSGASGAAPIFKEIMSFLHKGTPPPITEMPEWVVKRRICGISGMRPGRYCDHLAEELFIEGTEPDSDCAFHTGPGKLHELPPSYASWVHDKGVKGAAGSYRIKGMPDFLDDLVHDGDDDDLPAVAGIHVKGAVIRRTNGTPGIGSKVAEGHLSIGSEKDETLPDADGDIKISYPLPNDKFIHNKTGKTVIRFEAFADRPMNFVDWFIDGQFHKRSKPPYHFYWTGDKGRHEITAVTPGNRGDSIRLTIE